MELSDKVCGTASYAGPLPGDPDNNSTLTCSTVFGGVSIAFTYPTLNPYALAYTILYRGTTANFADAAPIANLSGNTYHDRTTVTEPTEYRYWIQHVSIHGTIMEPIGSVAATMNPLVRDLIWALTGQIDGDLLGSGLKWDLDQIEALRAALEAESNNRFLSEQDIANAFAELQSHADDAVNVILQEGIERLNGDSTLSQELADAKEVLGVELDTTKNQLQEAKEQLEQADASLEQAINNVNDLVSDITDNVSEAQGNVSDLLNRMTEAEEGLTLSNGMITDLSGTVDQFQQDTNAQISDITQGITDAKNDINDEIQARIDGDSGILETVSTHITSEYGPFKAITEQKIQDFTDADIAISTRADKIEAKVNVKPNLLPNGGFERGTEGWSSPYWFAADDAYYGRYLSANLINANGSGTIINHAWVYGAKPGQTYTLSWDSFIASDGGTIGMYFYFYDANGNALVSSASKYLRMPEFSIDDSVRYENAVTATAPEGTDRIRVSLFKSGSVSNVSGMGFRRIKLEAGSSATPYTADLEPVSIRAAVTSEEASRVAGDSANALRIDSVEANHGILSADVQDLQQSFATEKDATATSISKLNAKVNINPNLLVNGGFERGTEGWSGTSWELVDHPHRGRYMRVKPANLTNTGSLIMTQIVTGVEENKVYTYSFEGFVIADTATISANILFKDAAGTQIGKSSYYSYRQDTPEFDPSLRYSTATTFTTPAGCVRMDVRFFKIGTITNAVELGARRFKLEAGPVATPYTSDATLLATNAQISTMQQAVADLETGKASATDVSSLQTRMGNAESAISSSNTAISDLTNNKASAESVDVLKTQITGGSDSTNLGQINTGLIGQIKTSISNTENTLVQLVSSMGASSNTQFNAWKIWGFYSDVEGWTAKGGTLAKTDIGIKLTATVANNGVYSPTNLALDGKENYYIRCRVRRIAGTGWEGAAYYSNDTHGILTTYRKLVDEPDWSQGWVELMWDMSELSSGGSDWLNGGPIKQIDLDLGNTTADIFEFDWIAIGNPSPGVSKAELQGVQTAITDVTNAIISDVNDLNTQINTGGNSITARLNSTENALSSSVTGSVANRLDSLTTTYNQNKSQVDSSITGLTTNLSATTQLASNAKAKADANEADISDLKTSYADAETALNNLDQKFEARTVINPNLLPDGGFETGLVNWTANTYWDVVDDPKDGRYLKLKDSYKTATGSQVTYMEIPVTPGEVYTYSGEFIARYTSSSNTGSIGASLQCFNASGSQTSNNSIGVAGLGDDFNAAQRYENAVTITVPANTVKMRVRFYKIGNGSNIDMLAVRRLKLEKGSIATPYSSDAALQQNVSSLKTLQTTVTNLDTSLTQSVTNLSSTLGQRISNNEQSISTLSTASDTQASRTSKLESKTNVNPNLLPNGGFEFDFEDWIANSAYFEVIDDPVYGRYAAIKASYLNAAGTGSMQSPSIPAVPGQTYTASADMFTLGGTAGNLVLYLRFFNAAGSSIVAGSVSIPANSKPTFSADDSWRYDNKVTITAPSTAATMRVWCSKASSFGNATTAGFRRIKVEAGSIATPYTTEATLTLTNAVIKNKETTLNNSINTVAGSISSLSADFNSNKSTVSGQLLGITNAASALGSRVDAIEVSSSDNAADIVSERNARTTAYNSLTEDLNKLSSRTGANPNLLPNGGFEKGLDSWSNQTYWDVVDDPVYGRCIKLKSSYLNASGSIICSYKIEGIKPGEWLTFSADFFNSYNSSTRSGYAGASLQFVDSAGLSISNHSIPGAYINEEFDSARRFTDRFVTAQAPANTVAVNVRFYRNGGGQNSTGLGFRQLKVERGQVVTSYTNEGSLVYANAQQETKNNTFTSNINSLTTRTNTLEASVNTGTDSLSNLRAAIQSEAATRASKDSAIAQDISTLEATANGAVASAQTNAQAISNINGDLSAAITTKVQVVAGNQRVIAGTGLGIEPAPNGSGFQSSFNVWADRFQVWNGTNMDAVFAVVDGKTVIKDALIGKLDAGKINVTQLSALASSLGIVNAGILSLQGGIDSGWSYFRSGTRWWGDAADGWFFGRKTDGEVAYDMYAGGSFIKMHRSASGASSAEINFRGPNNDRGFYVNQNGEMILSELDVVKRANIAGSSVATVGLWFADNIYIGSSSGGQILWAQSIGNTVGVNAVIHFSFAFTAQLNAAEQGNYPNSYGSLSGVAQLRINGTSIATMDINRTSFLGLSRQMWLPAGADITITGQIPNSDIRVSARVSVICQYK